MPSLNNIKVVYGLKNVIKHPYFVFIQLLSVSRLQLGLSSLEFGHIRPYSCKRNIKSLLAKQVYHSSLPKSQFLEAPLIQ